jgi:site-specific DNA-methyltransferase (adenine-specific)
MINKEPQAEVVPVDKIDIGERFRRDYGDVTALALDMKLNGMISPVALFRRGDRFALAAGGRRMQAAKSIGMKDVPARIYDGDETEYDLRVIELAENIHRKNLDWVEEVALKNAIHDMQVAKLGPRTTGKDKSGWSQTDTAAMLGESPASISQDLDLYKAMEILPQLKTAKTKDEARKMVNKIATTLERQEKAATIQRKLSSQPTAVRKLSLVNSYIVGDFFAWADTQPDGIADVVEIDPPYAIDLNVKKKSDHEADSILKSTNGYNEVDPNNYPEFMLRTLMAAHRLLKKDGWLILWFGPDPWFAPMYQMATQCGFVGNMIPAIWAKEQGQTNAPNYYMGSAWEPFFYMRKGNPELAKKGRTNVFMYRAVPPLAKIHPTERPIEMMEDILSTFTGPGGFIVTPFAGSGNTILAACNLNCTAVGCDLTKEYKDAFMVRVDSCEPGDYNSYGRRT